MPFASELAVAQRKTAFALAKKTVWVAGHRGMVGAAVSRRLRDKECDLIEAGRDELDLTDQHATWDWMERTRPDAVVVAAARVGGIVANRDHPADFLRDNLAIAANVIEGARRSGVSKLLFIGSAAVYPQLAPQPMVEEELLTGPLDPTHEGYAIAKIAGIKLVQTYRRQYGCDFIACLPCNLYGPGDNFDPVGSHVVPGLIGKFHDAKMKGAESVTLWGTGTPLRELLFVDDLADACVFMLENYSNDIPLNVGSSDEVRIADLAERIGRVVDFRGGISWNREKPDGVTRRCLDSRRLRAMGWAPSTDLDKGLTTTYRWFVNEMQSDRHSASASRKE